ncbi:hypothetical protein F9K94_15420 [Brucella tritici]|uniref:Transposase n=1 Tax=Brucella tritici TaxID=94626 RepID=A0A7V8B1D2_9HYPH|nr:hypothetical protein [Brucella tritici]KAB2655915.1 hypothetical protein F9K94_15420 [Brucella tritici]
MSAPRLTSTDKGNILSAYVSGEPIKSISERFGVHPSYPGLLAKRRGLFLRSSATPQAPRTADEESLTGHVTSTGEAPFSERGAAI